MDTLSQRLSLPTVFTTLKVSKSDIPKSYIAKLDANEQQRPLPLCNDDNSFFCQIVWGITWILRISNNTYIIKASSNQPIYETQSILMNILFYIYILQYVTRRVIVITCTAAHHLAKTNICE